MAPSSKADKKKKDKASENKENDQRPTICCVPEEKVYCSRPEITDQGSVVKVLCSSGKCPKSGLMHSECFDKWQDLIVGFLAKQGRGRTWSDKQRYANVWANKGYDLVFKTCACDCGHGSLRKDLDFVPAAAPAEGGAGGGGPGPAQAQPDAQDKKKKKKEKTSLKPKLNFSVLNVTGSYFGSIKQKEDEQEENKWSKDPILPAKVVTHRLSSDKSDSPSPVPFIPGLNPPPVHIPPPVKPKADLERFEKASSAPPQPCDDGWVTIPAKVGSNRRNSQQSLKLKRKNSVETLKAHVSVDDNRNNNLDSKPVDAFHTVPPFNLEVHDPELLKKLRKKSPSGFPDSGSENFPSLPMYSLPPPIDKVYFESSLKYETNEPPDHKVLNHNQNSMESSKWNSNQHHEPEPSMAFPQYFGARPKYSPNMGKSIEEIYQSDEDISFEELDKNLEKLVEGSPSETPKWSASPTKSPILNPDKEMNILWEQTRGFERELNSVKAESIPKMSEVEQGGSSDGKRDKNGFIHCSSCSTVHTSTSDFTKHCNSAKHRDNAVWARKLESADIKADLTGGWEKFGKVVDSWEERVDMSESSFNGSESNLLGDFLSNPPPVQRSRSPASAFEEVKRRALSRDVDAKSAINEVKKQVMSKKKSKTNSRTSTPDFSVELEDLRKELQAEREAKEKALAENGVLKKEIIAENEARKRTLEELQILRNAKKNIEKQAVIVENTLKFETSEKLKFERLLKESEETIKRKEDEITILREEKEKHEAAAASALLEVKETDCDIQSVVNELKETKELLSQEQQKNEANSKLIKKQKEKSEKLIQRERDSRLLAEKSSELAEKQLATLEQKKMNLENQLKKEEASSKVAEVKMKEEARKRIVVELELVDQQKKFNEISDKFVKQAAVLNEEKNDLAKAVNGLVKDKEILVKDKEISDEKVNNARAMATERLKDFVNEETCKKILEDSEEMVKQSFLMAIESKEDSECFEDVKNIFNMIKEVAQTPLNELPIQKVKADMKKYLKTRSDVTEQGLKTIFDGLVQEGLEKDDSGSIEEEDGEKAVDAKIKDFRDKESESVGIKDIIKDVEIESVGINDIDVNIENRKDRIVNIESDDEDEDEADNCNDDQAVLLEDDIILDELKGVQNKQKEETQPGPEKKDPESSNSVFDLFDEVLHRKTQELKEDADGWEMFENELNIDGSLIEELRSEEVLEESKKKEDAQEMKNSDLKDDVIKDINEFLKDDVLKNCLNSIFKDAEVNKNTLEKEKGGKDENDVTGLQVGDLMTQQMKKLPKKQMKKLLSEEKSVFESDGLVSDDSLPGLDRYPKLGLDDEIDPYLGPDAPGEFDDYEGDDKEPEPLDYDKYDQLGCPCKGEHNPNGSCKNFPSPARTNPLSDPYYGVYLIEQQRHNSGLISKQITREESDAQWLKYIDPNYNPNQDEDLILPHPNTLIPPLLTRLSTCSLPPLPTNHAAPADPTENSRTRRFSSSISPASTSSPTDENFSSSSVNSTPLSSSPPESGALISESIPSSRPEAVSLPESSRLASLEHSVSMLQSMMNTMGTQVTNLTTQLEDSNFQSGLLSRTVEMMQDKNCQLQKTVDNLQERNILLEKKVSGNIQDSSSPPLDSSSDDVATMKKNLLLLLASCESFQKGFDKMTERQTELENKLKLVTNNHDKTKAENKELKKEFAQLNDKFSSLSLENQVDKGQMKAQLDSLGYNMAILTSKMPAESFSSTSGVRSGDISENEEGVEKVEKTDGISPFPLELKEIVSAVAFSREEPTSTEADSSTSTPKISTTSSTSILATTTTPANKMKKFVYNSTAVNTYPHHSPSGGPVWMSPDGSMVAVPPAGVPSVPPTSTHPALPLPTGTRSLFGQVPARANINQMPYQAGMVYPYMNQQGGVVYPLGTNMFYR